MDYDYPEFTVREEDSVTVVNGPDGEDIATFNGSGAYNPAFHAFLEGLKKVPGASVWSETGGKYLLHGGEVTDDSLKEGIEELLATKAELRLRR